MDKFEYYEQFKKLLLKNKFSIEDFKEINYGLQFNVVHKGHKHLIRIYEGKKGLRVDFSQIKNIKFEEYLESILSNKEVINSSKDNSELKPADRIEELSELIGTDESGKGDYFGPLVIAGVYADKISAKNLGEIGVKDSKQLSDNKIKLIAKKIKQVSKCTVVTIGNEKYNELYDKINNLNKLLAWGHARCIENVLQKVDAKLAISDQFGDESYIENALLKKGKKIILIQKPKAEKNIAVAAASILARNEFVMRLEKMSDDYKLNFPKGASKNTVDAGTKFVERYGREKLSEVAKIHFKTTSNILSVTK